MLSAKISAEIESGLSLDEVRMWVFEETLPTGEKLSESINQAHDWEYTCIFIGKSVIFFMWTIVFFGRSRVQVRKHHSCPSNMRSRRSPSSAGHVGDLEALGTRMRLSASTLSVSKRS